MKSFTFILLLSAILSANTSAIELPDEIKASFSAAEERETGITMIMRQNTISHIKGETEFHSILLIQSFSGNKSYVKQLSFSPAEKNSDLNIKNYSAGYSSAYDGTMTYYQHLGAYALIQKEPFSRENLRFEDLIAYKISDIGNLKKMGESDAALRAGTSSVYSGLKRGNDTTFDALNPYYMMIGKYASLNIGIGREFTWNELLSNIMKFEKIEKPGDVLRIRLMSENGCGGELHLSPQHDYLFAGSDIYTEEGKTNMSFSILEYKEVDGVYFPWRAKGINRGLLFGDGSSYEEYEFEILDLCLGVAEGISFGPGAVFVDRAQGIHQDTGLRFRYYADKDSIEFRQDGEDPVNIIEAEMLHTKLTSSVLSKAPEIVASDENFKEAKGALQKQIKAASPEALLPSQRIWWGRMLIGSGLLLIGIWFGIRLQRKRR